MTAGQIQIPLTIEYLIVASISGGLIIVEFAPGGIRATQE